MKRDVRTATEVDAFVGAKLKELRKSVKMSQTDLATRVGVTFQQIQKYERGTNRIGASRLWDFCKVFDVKPGRFFEGVEDHLADDLQMSNTAHVAPIQSISKTVGSNQAKMAMSSD